MAVMLVARIESRDPETVWISSNTKVSGPRPIPPEIFRPRSEGRESEPRDDPQTPIRNACSLVIAEHE